VSRKRICLLGSPLDTFYSRQFWKGAADRAEALGLDLVYLAGGFQRVYLNGFPAKCGLNESRSTLTYQILDPSMFSGFLIWGAQWQHDADDEIIVSLIARFAPLPVVSVGWSGPGCCAVLQDNYAGMREIIAHLIREHGHKRIAFLKSGHTFVQREAEERFRAYEDALAADGIPLNPQLVVYGGEVEEKRLRSFEKHSLGENWADIGMQELLDIRGLVPGRDFTALVARDDDAAMRCISNLKGRGFNVPRDVAVCGFDDIVAGRCWDPPLTTVSQSFLDQADQGMRLLHSVLQGDSVSDITYMEPSKPVIRESCGCLNQHMRRMFKGFSAAGDPAREKMTKTRNIESLLRRIAEKRADLSDLAEEIRAAIRPLTMAGEDPLELAEMLAQVAVDPSSPESAALLRAALVLVGDIAQRMQLRQFIGVQQRQEQLDTIDRDTFRTYDLDLVFDSVEAELPVIGASGCAIVLFLDPVNPLDQSRVIFASSRGRRNRRANLSAPAFSTREILPARIWPEADDPVSLYVETLYFAERRLGLLILERGDSDGVSYTSLASRLASVLEGAFLVRSLKEKQIELEKANAEILALSERDALTGLYNRRAFEHEFLKEKRRIERYTRTAQQDYSLLYIDVDNFKYYNDAFDHAFGDAVLKAIAEHLNRMIRTMDIVSRYGGDEFVILLPSTDLAGAEIISKRIVSSMRGNPELIRRVEELSGRTFAVPEERDLSCSIGISSSILVGNEPEDVLKSADHALYQAKQKGRGRYCIAERSESGRS
jgi:diguanylate cyclase (GGDEF)-like protein